MLTFYKQGKKPFSEETAKLIWLSITSEVKEQYEKDDNCFVITYQLNQDLQDLLIQYKDRKIVYILVKSFGSTQMYDALKPICERENVTIQLYKYD